MNDNKDRYQSPKDVVNAIVSNLTEIRQKMSNSLDEVSYQIDSANAIKGYWGQVAPAQASPDGVPTLYSGLVVLNGWRTASELQLNQLDTMGNQIKVTSGTAEYMAANTGTLSRLYPQEETIDDVKIIEVTEKRRNIDVTEAKLRGIDASIGNMYHTVWRSLHVEALDPYRGPLFLMREIFNHLLDILAPDDQITQQKNFVGNPELIKQGKSGVTRKHRFEYFKNTRITTESERQQFESTWKNFSDTYEDLNEAHKRGQLNIETAKQAIYSADALLHKWMGYLD